MRFWLSLLTAAQRSTVFLQPYALGLFFCCCCFLLFFCRAGVWTNYKNNSSSSHNKQSVKKILPRNALNDESSCRCCDNVLTATDVIIFITIHNVLSSQARLTSFLSCIIITLLSVDIMLTMQYVNANALQKALALFKIRIIIYYWLCWAMHTHSNHLLYVKTH